MQERIQKIISAAGIASRRAAEKLILEGGVTVSSKVVTELGTKADPGKEHIKVDGKLIKSPPRTSSGAARRSAGGGSSRLIRILERSWGEADMADRIYRGPLGRLETR